MQLKRRDFLKLSGAALAGGIALPQVASRAPASRVGDLGILYDASKCVGCRACQMACKDWNKLPGETTDAQKLYETPLGLSADTWTLIKLKKSNQADWHFFNYQCMHCTDAACVTVCPTGALFKDERGFTAYDREKCNGCGYCTEFCPFGVPHLKTQSLLTGEAKAAKCTFCQDRIWGGLGGPSCAEACPVEALVWGQREELLGKARERVATLQAQGLSAARLYGENETGGLHRLSILFDEPAQYNLPQAPPGAIANAWQKIIQPLGEVALGATVLGVIAAFFITRRNIRMEEVE
jgi:formate dehydrogenase iron-sulfur subunit